MMGYEVRMYHDISSIAESLAKIAKCLEKMADYGTGMGGISSEIVVLRKDLTDALNAVELGCTRE